MNTANDSIKISDESNNPANTNLPAEISDLLGMFALFQIIIISLFYHYHAIISKFYFIT